MSLSINGLRRMVMAVVVVGLSAAAASAQSGGMPMGMPAGFNPNMQQGQFPGGMPQGMNGRAFANPNANLAGPQGGNPAELGGNVLEQAWNAAARTAAMARQMGSQGGPNMAAGQGMNPQMLAAQRNGQGGPMGPQGNQFAAANFGPNGPMAGGNGEMNGMPRMNGPMGGMGQGPMGNNGQMAGPNGRGFTNPNQNPNLQNPQFQRQMAGNEMGAMGPQGPMGEEGQGPMNYRANRPQSAPEQGSIDVVLEDVVLAGDATLVAGPAYAVRFRNQGLQSAGKFVVLVGASLDGHLTQDSPKTVIEVPGIEAGKGIEVMLRLPKSALQMDGKEFTHLIVMVDAKNSLVESDKSNNGAVLERSALERAQGPAAQGPAAQDPSAQAGMSGLGVMGQLPQ